MGRPTALMTTIGLLLSIFSGGALARVDAHGHGRPDRVLSAHMARALNATDTARLRYISSSGSLLFEEGTARGTLPGSMRAHCNLGATFSASFTIYTHGGTITGHGTATPHGSGIYESFAGTLVVSGGTGRYVHAHGHAGLYGTFNRRTYALTVQTTGSLSY
ncbi:MAG TPA: autotransporter [Solirubrobacteraceae bacterium]|nr:autotransporter [Solirubrobacteraceae bacterium]